MKTILNKMFENFDCKTLTNKENAFKEIAQNIVLCALARTDFFSKASFYGGTCLRIFHGVNRFSEDLDFELLGNERVDLSLYFETIKKEFLIYGLATEITKKDKNNDTIDVETAIISFNAKESLLMFFSDDEEVQKIVSNQKIKIKYEISNKKLETPIFEYNDLLLPTFCQVRCHDLSTLFADKICAVLSRKWFRREKGRDFYDFAYYMSLGVKPNYAYIKEKLINNGYITNDFNVNRDSVYDLLVKRFNEVNYSSAKEDVIGFLNNPNDINQWSSEYFTQLAKHLL